MKKLLFILSLAFLVSFTGIAQKFETLMSIDNVVIEKKSKSKDGEKMLTHSSLEKDQAQSNELIGPIAMQEGSKGPVGTNWMTWFQGPTYSLSGAGATQFGVYQRFAVEDIADYVGQYLTKIKYIINPSAVSGAITYYTAFSTAPKIQVYVGGSVVGTTYDPGTLVAEVLATNYDYTDVNSLNFYNFAELSTPILIDGTQEVWFGINFSPSQTCYPAVSSNSASADLGYIEGKTNIFYYNGSWATTYSYFTSYRHVWDLAAYTRDALPTEVCNISVEMEDEFGDGWNDATISFFDSYNNEWNIITCNEATATSTVTLPIGNISCYWTPANYDEEVSFVIKNSEGTTIFTCETGDFEDQEEGIFFTFNNTSCLTNPPQECDPVTGLTVDVNGANATIMWDAITGAVEYKVFLGYIEVATVADPTYTFSDLENESNYIASVTPVFNDDCISLRTDISFTVLTCDDPPTNLNVAYNLDCDAVLTWTFEAGTGGDMLLWDQMQVGQTTSGYFSQSWNDGDVHIVDDFVLDANTVLTKISAYTGYTAATSLPTSLGIKIWDSNADGAPNTLIHTITGLPYATGTITLDISSENIELAAGRYWLSVYGISTSNYSSGIQRYLWITGPTVVGNVGYLYGSVTNSIYGIANNSWYSLSAQASKSAVFSVYGIPEFEPTFNVYRDGVLVASELTELTYTDTGFSTTEGHVWSVKATCLNGGLTEAAILDKEACVSLDPITDLTANVVSTTVYLNWSAPGGKNMTTIKENELSLTAQYVPYASKGLTGYEVFFNGTSLGTTTNTYYNHTGVAEGEHEYCVVAVYDEGSSEQVCIDVEVLAPAECNPVTDLTVEYDENCAAELSWTAPAKGNKAPTVLWDNTNIAVPTTGNNGLISSSWTDTYVLVADDFEAEEGWIIDKVVTSGFYSSGSATTTQLRIVIMDDDNDSPGTVLVDEIINYTVAGSWDLGTLWSARLSTPFEISTAGKYWIGVAAHFNVAKPATLNNARWNIYYGYTGISTGFYLHDPSNAFGSGTDWMLANPLLGDAGVSMYFQLLSPDPDAKYYNVYRDGVQIAQGIETTSYTDSGFDQRESHNWTVTVVCEDGESEPLTIEKESCKSPNCEDVVIGTGTTGTNAFPVNTYYRHSYSQQIFDAAEIGTFNEDMMLTSISFQYIYSTATTKDPVTIYIGNTTKTEFTSTTDWVPLLDMRQVFTGSITFNNTNNWVTINFDTPYAYTGGNLVVAVLNNAGAYDTGSNNTFYYHTTTGYKTLHYRVDGTVHIDPLGLPAGYARVQQRNNAMFEFCPAEEILACEEDLVTIGTGTTGTYLIPINTFYRHTYSQQIFDASEIGYEGETGKISSVAFQYFYSTAQDRQNFSVYIGNTDKTAFASTTDWVAYNELELVYTGTLHLDNTGENYWVTIPFDTEFEYAGGNVVVAVLDNEGAYYTSSNNTFYAHTASDYKTLHYRVDGTTQINPATPPTAYARVTTRNNIQFDVCIGGAVTCDIPTDLAVTYIDETSATVTWTPAEGTYAWNLEIVETGQPQGSGTIVSALNPTYTFTPLTENTSYTVYLQTNCGGGDISEWIEVSFITDCYAITALPFSEGFEGGNLIPECWRQEYVVGNNDWLFRTNTSNPSAPHTGSYNAAFAHSITGNTTKLISPQFDFSSYDEVKLSFWHAQFTWSGDQDYLKVYYKNDRNSEWVLLDEFTEDISTWQQDYYLLPELSSTYWIAFEGVDGFGYGVVLDDIYIYVPEYTILTGEVTHQGNPVEGATVYFKGDYAEYTETTNVSGVYTILEAEVGTYDGVASKIGYHSDYKNGEDVSQPVTRIDFVLTAPDFYVVPEEVTVQTTYTVDGYAGVTLHNDGDGAVDWALEIEYLDKSGSKDAWDLVYNFAGSSEGGQQGIATDGNYIYTAFWGTSGKFAKYEMDGTFIENFTIASVGGIRDLAYDGSYFYGGASSTTMYVMDFVNKTLISTITTPENVRHCTYDPSVDGFWIGDWTTLRRINRDGTSQVTGTTISGVYGSAYDNVTVGGPYLLLFSQTAYDNSQCLVYQYDIANNTLASTPIININMLPGFTYVAGATGNSIAGGAFTAMYEDKLCFFANIQQTPNQIGIFELGKAGWLSTETMTGHLEPGESQDVLFKMDGSWAEEGEWHANANFIGTPGAEPATVFVTFIIGESPCAMPENLTAEIKGMYVAEDMNDVILTWELGDKAALPKMEPQYPKSMENSAPASLKADWIKADPIYPNVIYTKPASKDNEIFNQAELITHVGQAYNGADASSLEPTSTTYGSNAGLTLGYMIADDFTLVGNTIIEEMEFYCSQQNTSSTTSTITGVYVQIYDASPASGGQVVWGDMTTNRLVSTEWTGIYRTSSTNIATFNTLPIQTVIADMNNLELPMGEYWVVVAFTGSLSDGPWAVPRQIWGQTNTGNGMQYSSTGWIQWTDGGSSYNYGLPFIIRGTVVETGLLGFNIYRDGFKINEDPILTFSYTDEDLDWGMEYCYSVQAVYDDCISNTTDIVCITIPEDPCALLGIPYAEGFEFEGYMPLCWSQEIVSAGPNGTAPMPWQIVTSNTTYPSSAAEGQYFALFPDRIGNRGTYITKLVSPQFDLTDYEKVKLQFKAFIGNWGGTDDTDLKVYYKNSPDGAWTLAYQELSMLTSWTELEVIFDDLSETFWFAFEGTNQYGYGLAIDDVILDIYCDPVENLTGTVVARNVSLSWTADLETLSSATVLEEGFESGSIPATWTNIDADNDGQKWTTQGLTSGATPFDLPAYSGNYAAGSGSFINTIGALTPDNWLVTPQVNLGANGSLTFMISGNDATLYYEEHYGVYVSTTGNNPSDFTLLFEETIATVGAPSYQLKTIDLSAYSGNVYIAFRHFNCTDQYFILLDDVKVVSDMVNPTFDVYRDDVVIANDINGLLYVDMGLSNGTYEYCVIANYSNGCVSDPACVTVDVLYFDPPINLEVTTQFNVEEAYLTWEVEDYLTPLGFNVYRDGTQINTSLVEEMEYVDETIEFVTDYCYKVTAVYSYNSTTEESDPSNEVCITTPCYVFGYPFYEGFEDNNTDLPICWDQEYLTVNIVDWTVIPTGTYYPPYAGTYSARLYYAGYDRTTKLVTPYIDLTTSDMPVLKFWHRQSAWAGDQDRLKVYYRTDIDGAWILLDEYTTEVTDWTERVILLPEISGTFSLAFEGLVNYGHGVGLDEISITDYAFTECGDAPVVNSTVDINDDVIDITIDWAAMVSPSSEPATQYAIYRNGLFIGYTDELTYAFDNEQFGELEYCVRAMYPSCVSPLGCATELICPWITDLTGVFDENVHEVYLTWDFQNYDGTVNFLVYRDGEYIGSSATTNYIDGNMEIGTYEYCVRVEATDIPCTGDARCVTVATCGQPVVALDVAQGTSDIKTTVLTWSAPNTSFNIANYKVYRDAVLISTLPSTEVTYTDDDASLDFNIAYTYTVAAVYSGGCEVNTNESITLNILAPTNVFATTTSNEYEVNISWQAPAQEIVTGYKLYSNNIEIATITAPTTLYTDVFGPGSYDFCVSAVYNTYESDRSCATTLIINNLSTCEPVADLAANVDNCSVELTWTAPEVEYNTIISYTIFKNGVEIAETTNTSYTEFEALAGSYTYGVFVNYEDITNCTNPLSEVSVSINLPAITNFAVTSENTRVNMVWTAVSNASTYRIYEDGNFLAEVSSLTYSYDVLAEGTYTYDIEAVFVTGCITTTTQASTLVDVAEVTNVNATVQNDDITVVVTWTAPTPTTNFTAYNVYRDGDYMTTIYNISTTTFTDVPTEAGTYLYCVSALYSGVVESEFVCDAVTLVYDDQYPAVTAMNVVDKENLTVVFGWTGNERADVYNVYIVEGSTDVYLGSTTNLNYMYKFVAETASAQVGVTAMYGQYESAKTYLTITNVVVNAVPSINAESSLGNVTLTWTSPSDTYNDLVGYALYRDGELIATTSALTLEYTDIPNEGILHNYCIEALYGPNAVKSVQTCVDDINPEFCEPVTDLYAEKWSDDLINITWNAPANVVDASYNIYRQGVLIAVVDETSYQDTEQLPSGTYTYSVSMVCEDSSQGESSRVNFTITVSAGIGDADIEVNVYPNPASDYVIVECDAMSSIRIFNNSGQLVKVVNINAENRVNISVQDFASGVYHFEINTINGERINNRVVVGR
ncbi:MAG: choice-of-anchor J domain-containing protein [Bacteroidales bacterium]|jgi:hypothetical protein|nr:choice-of-anchor J domain-containing protein [Bacteroidales bacterium]